jgi:antitoxin component of MazEF toxin-antitoxin module
LPTSNKKITPKALQSGATVGRKKYRLSELVARITKKNRHAEVDWGPSVGAEEWK